MSRREDKGTPSAGADDKEGDSAVEAVLRGGLPLALGLTDFGVKGISLFAFSGGLNWIKDWMSCSISRCSFSTSKSSELRWLPSILSENGPGAKQNIVGTSRAVGEHVHSPRWSRCQ